MLVTIDGRELRGLDHEQRDDFRVSGCRCRPHGLPSNRRSRQNHTTPRPVSDLVESSSLYEAARWPDERGCLRMYGAHYRHQHGLWIILTLL